MRDSRARQSSARCVVVPARPADTAMQFLATLRARIRRGEITCSVRLWQREHVKVGGRYSLPPGHIQVTSVSEMALADITPALARESGFAGMVDLLKTAKHGP